MIFSVLSFNNNKLKIIKKGKVKIKTFFIKISFFEFEFDNWKIHKIKKFKMNISQILFPKTKVIAESLDPMGIIIENISDDRKIIFKKKNFIIIFF